MYLYFYFEWVLIVLLVVLVCCVIKDFFVVSGHLCVDMLSLAFWQQVSAANSAHAHTLFRFL